MDALPRPDHKLTSDTKVAVIGGGPAGSLFALNLLHYASERGTRPQVAIYQDRAFGEPGPRGCKGCAGILSLSLLRNLEDIGLSLPDDVVQGQIGFYAVHSPEMSISISNPEQGATIASIYRGGGPLESHGERLTGFDGWLLAEAERRGAEIRWNHVSHVDLSANPRVEVSGEPADFDLVVLATGANATPVRVTGLDYVPPRTSTMAQVELYAGADQTRERLGNTAHAFLIPGSRLIFGTLVPKGPFINVSVLSKGEPPVSVAEFLSLDIVRERLPEGYERACSCRPKAIITSARNPYADGFVALGDAAVSRLYKDGIGSALLTAREAARIVARHGFSRHDFDRHYRPLCRRMTGDNRWGRFLFAINNRTKDSRMFLLAQQRLIGDEQTNARGAQPFTKVVWGMFTGTYSYRAIARMALNPVVLARLAWALARERPAWLTSRGRGEVARRVVHIGSRKVLILGSGFGGTYVMRHLVPSLNRNEHVETTMVSDENFFLFSPLLHEVAMGAIETRHVAYPIRRLHWRDRFDFVQASVRRIDLDNKQVITADRTLDYDYLVMALGSVADTSGLDPQALESGNVFTLKTLYDSVRIRNHLMGTFERASVETDPERRRQLLTIVVVGGGYIGVQVITELLDLIFRNVARFYRTIDPSEVRMVLAEAGPGIATRLQQSLAAYIVRYLERNGAEVLVNSRVTRAGNGFVEINGSDRLPAGTVIWVAGVVSNPLVAGVSAETDDLGRVVVDRNLEVPGFPGVYAVGDCAHFVDTKSGQPIPPRAHTTVRQARVAARNILADIRGRAKKAYPYSNPVEIVSLGSLKAVFRYKDFRLYGFPARLIWVVSYAYLITGTYNRVRVLLDWFLSLVFGRDTTFVRQIR
jgi:NADH dehydrogenase